MDEPVGRVGSGRVQEFRKISGSGHAFTGSGRVGSQNLDPHATLSSLSKSRLSTKLRHRLTLNRHCQTSHEYQLGGYVDITAEF